MVNGTHHNWDFQGQERTEDFGLNVHEWKYRISDPAIGRFWQLDPLAEKYNWMTTYQFSSNQPIHAPELEGMESFKDLNIRNELTQYGRIDISVEEVEAAQDAFDEGFLNTTVAGASLLAPGPEDVILGASIIKWIGGLFRSKKTVKATIEISDKAKDVSKTTDKTTDVKKMDDVIKEKKVNPKKAAREAGKKKREQQPASEKRAKDYAKDLEKREGKDARRKAHDKKGKGQKNRTVKELKEDYKINN